MRAGRRFLGAGISRLRVSGTVVLFLEAFECTLLEGLLLQRVVRAAGSIWLQVRLGTVTTSLFCQEHFTLGDEQLLLAVSLKVLPQRALKVLEVFQNVLFFRFFVVFVTIVNFFEMVLDLDSSTLGVLRLIHPV